IDVEFRDKRDTFTRIDLLVERSTHAVKRHLKDFGDGSDRACDLLVARGHTVKGAVRFYMIKRHAFTRQETGECAHLIDKPFHELAGLHLHRAPPEPLKVGQRRMRANFDSVLFGKSYGARHNARIRSVESARHIGDRYVRHDRLIITHLVEPEALTHVTVDAYQH